MQDLKDKVAVVTGAASGIGRAMADRFAAEGMRVVLADVEADTLEQAAHELRVGGADVIEIPTNVADGDAVESLARGAFEAFGDVHVLCNNAGVAVAGPVWERTIADWEWVMGVNFWGVVHAIRSFVPRMLERGGPGHIVNTASVAGLISPPFSAPYTPSKHAVVALSECLHHDLRVRGSALGVSVLCPGFVKTRIVDSNRNRPSALSNVDDKEPTPEDAAVMAAMGAAIEQGVEPSEIAEAVVTGIRDGRFYMLTHPELTEAVRHRMTDILENRVPVTRML